MSAYLKQVGENGPGTNPSVLCCELLNGSGSPSSGIEAECRMHRSSIPSADGSHPFLICLPQVTFE